MPNNRAFTARTADTAKPSEAVIDAVVAFERAWREINGAKRRQTATFGALLLMIVAGSMYVSEVSVRKFVEGLPGLLVYIHGTLPMIRAESFAADIAEWYWGIGRWLGLLLDTILVGEPGCCAAWFSRSQKCHAPGRSCASPSCHKSFPSC